MRQNVSVFRSKNVVKIYRSTTLRGRPQNAAIRGIVGRFFRRAFSSNTTKNRLAAGSGSPGQNAALYGSAEAKYEADRCQGGRVTLF